MKAPVAARVPCGGFFFPFFPYQSSVVSRGAFFRSCLLKFLSTRFGRGVRGSGLKIIKSRHGVTLVELMAAMAILAVLSGMAGFGILRGMPERRMMSAAREIYCGLRQAQAKAVSLNERIAVNFDPDTEAFSLIDTEGNTISRTKLPGYIDLYQVTGDNEKNNHFFFNSRGIKTGISGSVAIKYPRPGYSRRRVRVTSVGSMVIQRSDDDGNNWG